MCPGGTTSCEGPGRSLRIEFRHTLGIRETAHTDLSALDYDYDFRVLDSPGELRRLIEEKNAETGSARMVAGYCWDWLSKKDPDAWDVVIGEDLVVRDGELVTQPEKRSHHDHSIRGWKTWRRRDRERADAHARMVVLNTYRTLMTRGLKGCHVWAVDEGVRGWLRGHSGPSSG